MFKAPQRAPGFHLALSLSGHPPDADSRSGAARRYHLHASGLQKQVRWASITKRVACHTLSHAFTPLLCNGTDVRTVQERAGHADVTTTMI